MEQRYQHSMCTTIPSQCITEEFRNIAEFARNLHNVDTIHVLPYHTLEENKYSLLGKAYDMDYDTKTPSERRGRSVQENCPTLNYEEVNYEFRSIRND